MPEGRECPNVHLPLLLPDAKAIRKTVLKLKILRLASFKGSKGALVKDIRTKDRSQEGIPLFRMG